MFTIGIKELQEYIMGSYSSTQIGNIAIDIAKNSLPFSGFLFCNEDKKRIYVPEYSEYHYFLTRKLQTILPTLNLFSRNNIFLFLDIGPFSINSEISLSKEDIVI